MGQVIKIKHSTTPGNKPASLAGGELAINVSDGNLFFGDGSNVQNYLHLGTTTASTVSITKTLVVTGQTDLHSNLVMNSNKITSLLDPTTSQDAATKAYVDLQTGGAISNYLPLSGGTMSGVIAMGTNKITGVANPTSAQDAATKGYVDGLSGATDNFQEVTNNGNTTTNTIGIGSSVAPSYQLHVTGDIYSSAVVRSSGLYSTFGTFSSNINANGNIVGDGVTNITGMNNITATNVILSTGAVSVSGLTSVGDNIIMNSNKITSLLDPTLAQDAATKAYVDQYATSGVSSVAISGSDGIDVDSGSPITSSGTIALGLSKDRKSVV